MNNNTNPLFEVSVSEWIEVDGEQESSCDEVGRVLRSESASQSALTE